MGTTYKGPDDLWIVTGRNVNPDGTESPAAYQWYVRRKLVREGRVPRAGDVVMVCAYVDGKQTEKRVRVESATHRDDMGYDEFKKRLKEDPSISPRLAVMRLVSTAGRKGGAS